MFFLDDSNVNLSSSNSGVDGEKDRINSSIGSKFLRRMFLLINFTSSIIYIICIMANFKSRLS